MSFIQELEAATKNSQKVLRPVKREAPVLSDPSIKLNRWKFMDWAYYRDDLVTYARGLFTYGDKVIIRGYDKFFNCGETPQTKWSYLEENTVGPYYCTRKENGCIIFVSGINGKLVVTSKQSTESRHASVGQDWVRKHLASVNKTEAELAKFLEDNQLTAAGELCDDDFEEHIIPYDPKNSGIYLTGLNHNTRYFETLDFETVQNFAREWGFIVTQYHTCESISDLKAFLEEGAKTGSWNGDDIEGFVIRCKVYRSQNETVEGSSDPSSRELCDFFFKYKFEEPYMMHRCWKKKIEQHLGNPNKPMNIKAQHRKSTMEFLKFFNKYHKSHPEIKERILEHGKGFHHVQREFYKSTSLTGEDLINLGFDDGSVKIVLVPVATLGCGKTTLGRALSKLYGWGHVQNDDLPAKGKQQKLIDLTMSALESSDVVIFDRNNHMRREREQMFTDLESAASTSGIDLVFVCLDFWPNSSLQDDELRSIAEARVHDRGNNHQTITNMSKAKVTSIMKGFYGRYEPVVADKSPDDQFDSIIPLEVSREGSRGNIVRVIDIMHTKYGFKTFTDKEIDDALKYALDVHVPKKSVPDVPQGPIYYGLSVDPKTLKKLIPKLEGQDNKNCQNKFHVTVAHSKSHKKQYKALSQKHTEKFHNRTTKTVPLGETENIHVLEYCYNDKVAAFLVETETPSANPVPHITVACAPGVRPVESNNMLQSKDITRIKVDAQIQGKLCAFY